MIDVSLFFKSVSTKKSSDISELNNYRLYYVRIYKIQPNTVMEVGSSDRIIYCYCFNLKAKINQCIRKMILSGGRYNITIKIIIICNHKL